jgi:hypothetical protein
VFAVVGLAVGSIGWWVRGVPRLALGVVLAVGLAGAAAGTLAGVDGYPWSDLVVLAVAIVGGILLGSAIPPRARPMLLVLVALAVLDAAQLFVGGGRDDDLSATWFSLVVRGSEGNVLQLGVGDLVLVVAMAVHGAKRGLRFWPAVLPGPVGLLAALAYGWLVRPPDGLVLVPFLLVGWVLVEIWVIGTKQGRSTARDTRG